MPFESLLVLSVTCCVVAEHNAVVSFFCYAISEPVDTVIVTCAILELVDILAVTGYALSELISIICVICAY